MASKKTVVLICGLPGSGKSTLAQDIRRGRYDVVVYNADEVRKGANDWDFSPAGRLRQADRMKFLSETCWAPVVILDFICPTVSLRSIIKPDILIWVNTIAEGRYEDTNKMWEPPSAAERLRPGFVELRSHIPHANVAEFFAALVPVHVHAA